MKKLLLIGAVVCILYTDKSIIHDVSEKAYMHYLQMSLTLNSNEFITIKTIDSNYVSCFFLIGLILIQVFGSTSSLVQYKIRGPPIIL